MTGVVVALALLLSSVGLITASPASAATAGTITSAGPLTKVFVSPDLNCAVDHTGDSHGEFYGDTACGTFVAVGNTTYGPATVPAGPKDPGTSGYKKFTKVSQSAVTGTGSAADPFKLVTVVTAGTTGIRLTQTDTYVVGQESYRTDVAVANTSVLSANAVLYRAGDCYLQNDDNGFGSVDAATGAISCVNAVTNSSGQKVPGSRVEQWFPLTAGSRYTHDLFTSLWSGVTSRAPFSNTCNCTTYRDNGAGLSWSMTLPAGQSTTRSHLLTFQPVLSSPLITTKTADSTAVTPGAATGYTIKLTNPNAVGVTVTSITDDLPAGFSYRSGSSSGVTATDPVATNGGLHLVWNGQYAVAAGGQISLHFGANASSTAGDYFNHAGGAAAGSTTVTPTGDTAKVTVLGPATLNIAADRASVPANPASVPSTDVPLQRSSPDVQSAGIIRLPLISSPVIRLPLISSPVVRLPLISSPVVRLPLISSPVIRLPLISSPLGFDSLGDDGDLGSSPLVKAGLARVSLAGLRIISGPDWPARLAGTSLAGRPLAAVTWGDVLAAHLPEDKVPSIEQLDLSQSPLGALTSLSYFMGDTRLKAIGGSGFGWCAKLEGLGYADCGSALGVQGSPDKGQSASLLSLEIAGVSLDAIDGLKLVQLKDVTFPAAGQALLPAILLSSFDLSAASVGGILVNTVPAGVIDCTKIDCSASSTKTVYDASRIAGALRATATIGELGAAAGDLSLQEAVLGTYASDVYNPFDVPSEQLGLLGYSGPGASLVTYHVTFTNQSALAHPTIVATLPAQFRYAPGTAVVKQDGTPVAGVSEPTATNETLTWNLGNLTLPAGHQLTVDFGARPGLQVGSVNASVVVSGDNFSLNAATGSPLTVAENFENGDQPANTTAVQPGRLQLSHLGHAGDVDYFTIPAPTVPGSEINVFMTCGTCDADVTLFHPTSAAPHNPMRPASAAPEVRPELDQTLGLASSGEPLQPLALDDIPMINRPVAGISANRGTESESVRALSWEAPAGADYLIQVSSYLGSTSPEAYGLYVVVAPPAGRPPVGDARAFAHDADATREAPPATGSYESTKSLVIVDRTRLRRAYGDAPAQVALDAVNRLAAAEGLGIKVMFLDGFADVQALFAQLDARPSAPERSNDVVRAINAHVDAALGAGRSALRNIVLVGSDEILPMARIPDLTATANELGFSQELKALATSTGGNNALLGAASSAAILTDDAYCSFAPRPFLGTFLYMPDAACGRLVESPADIAAVIDQFLTPTQSGDGPGVLRPSKSLSAGADFMKTLAEQIKSTLNSQLTPGQVAGLISDTWKRSDLQAAFPAATPPPDIVAANAHFSPSALLPADASEGLFTTSAFGGSTPPDIAKRIVMTMGCHSGFSISNFLSADGSAPDWAESMLGRGAAAFVGNTGYGIGLRSTIAFSEKIFGDFAGNMARMPLGRALTQAKRTYLGGNQPNVYDYKVMAQATYFGLPMFKVAGALDDAPPLPAARPTVTDGPTGLTAVDISVSNPADNRWQLIDNGEGKYYQLPGGELMVAPNRPIQPKVTLDVTQPGLEARSAWLTGLQSVDQTGFDPALARTVVGKAAAETEVQFGDTIFPTAIQSVNDNKVSIAAAQFQSGPSGTVSGLERRFTLVNGRVFLVPIGTPHGDPVFRSITAGKNGSTASFRAVVDDPLGGVVRQAAVLFNDGTSNNWTFRQLAQAPDGAWVGGFPIASDHFQYIAEAVTDRGDLALTTNKGDYFDFASRPPGSAEIHAVVSPAEANGWYPDGATATLTGEGMAFSVSDNGGPASTWSSGQPIPVHGSGVHTLHYVASPGGASGDVTVAVDTTKPTITGAPTAPPNGDGWYRGPVTVHFACSDAHSGVASCEPDRTLSADGTAESVTGRAVDQVGNFETATVGGINIDTAPPTISGATTTPANANGWHNATVTVHFSCVDDRSGVASCPADQTISTEGANQQATGTAVDKAGNSTSFTVTGINIDRTPPTITGSPDRPANVNGWYRGPVTVSFSCADPGGSGAACPAPQILSSQGANQSASATATDAAGNTATATVTGINIDTGLPTITGASDRPANAAGWYNAPVTVAFSCGDVLAGVDSCNAPVTIGSEGSNQSVTGSATDKAGNTAFATVAGLNIDRTVPAITASPNDGVWRKGPVTVKFACGDDRSGVASCPADVVVTAEGATQVSGTVTDKAGNSATVSITVRIDNTRPASAFNGSGTILVLPGGPVRGTATDTMSGIAGVSVLFKNNTTGSTQTKAATVTCAEPRTSCTWSVPAPTLIGFYTATAIATDRAGNAQNPGTVRAVQVIS